MVDKMAKTFTTSAVDEHAGHFRSQTAGCGQRATGDERLLQEADPA